MCHRVQATNVKKKKSATSCERRWMFFCSFEEKHSSSTGINNCDGILKRWQCLANNADTLSEGTTSFGETEVRSNPIKCLFKHNERLTKKVESALGSQGAHLYHCRHEVISLTQRSVGLSTIHLCSQRAFGSSTPTPPPLKCLHIQGRAIYSKGPSHIWWCMTVFHFYSYRVTLCGWPRRLDGAALVWQRGGRAELGARGRATTGNADWRVRSRGLEMQGTDE